MLTNSKSKRAGEILQVFQHFDINGDGVLTRVELAAIMQQLDKDRWNNARLDRLMNALDKNHDGAVDYEDFVAWIMSSRPTGGDPKEVMAAAKERLSLESLKKLVGAKAGKVLLDRLLDDFFNYYDENRNGVIDRIEFLAVEERRMKAAGASFGKTERVAVLEWFQNAGAEGDLRTGMYLAKDQFKEAMMEIAVTESGVEQDELNSNYYEQLAEWTWKFKMKAMVEMVEVHAFSGLSPRWNIRGLDNTIFSIRFSPDDEYLAAALDTGDIHVYGTAAGKPRIVLSTKTEGLKLPVTMLRWRPYIPDAKTLLVSVGSDGSIIHWDVGLRKVVSEITEPDNELFCIDYKPDGSQFATGGRQRYLSVYDEATRKPLFQMQGLDEEGHSNRVFALKYHPIDPNVLLSGSWDDMVKFWDLREGARVAIRTIPGPHICGDAVDISKDGETVVTGSALGGPSTKQLQTWSFSTGKLIDTYQWRATPGDSSSPACKVYTAQFSKHDGSKMIAAGGSDVEEVKLFDWKNNWAPLGEIICPVDFDGCCQSLDFSNSGEYLAVGTSKGAVRVMNTFAPLH